MIYVDHARIPYMRMLMSHLLADTSDELQDMAERLGLDQYVQAVGTFREHLDVSEGKRSEAIKLGAQEVTVRELVALRRSKAGGLA